MHEYKCAQRGGARKKKDDFQRHHKEKSGQGKGGQGKRGHKEEAGMNGKPRERVRGENE